MTKVGGNKVPEITGSEHISPEHTGDNISAKRVASYGWDGSNWQRIAVNPDGSLTTGGSEYATRIDDVTTTNITYVGKAPIGSATSSAVWQIMRIDNTNSPETTIVTWADSNANFDNIWDNHTSLTYG